MEDRAGRILAGISNAGLAIFEGDSIRSVSTKNGLPSNTIYCMTEDSYGRLWIGTTIGMAYEDHPGSKRFIQNQAFAGSPVHCCGTTRNGLLWYVTATDLFVYDYANDAGSTLPPPTYITGLKVNGNTQSLQSGFQLSNQENSCEINFIGISFKDEEAIRYRYRLAGAETEWQGPTINNSITYGHLDPGSYTFEVKAINVDGVESANPATLSIAILPPYWQTWWFIALAIFIFLSLGPSIYFWRVSQLKKERAGSEEFSRRLIESQETERKRIARELHDDLGQELVLISNRARRGKKNAASEQEQEQFQQIGESASHALDSVREIAYNLSPYHLEQVGLAGVIKGMIERVATLSDVRFTIEVDPCEGLLSKEYETHVYRVVQESVTNVVKHSHSTQAEVRMKREDGTIEIIIHDNGKGFDSAILSAKSGARSGFGFSSMAERVKLLGATMRIETSAGNGTKISISVPVGGSGETENR